MRGHYICFLEIKKIISEVHVFLILSLPETKIADFANSVDLDEVAHKEPPHLDLHCLPSSLCLLNII